MTFRVNFEVQQRVSVTITEKVQSVERVTAAVLPLPA